MRELIFLTLANHLPRIGLFDKIRFIVYQLAGVKMVGRSVIFGPLTIRPIGCAKNISIGRGTFINTEVRFGVHATVTIGDRVQIGPRVMFETFNHDTAYRFQQGTPKARGGASYPITIEDEVWVGAGAIIMPGVTLGKGAVIAAGAVVTADVEKNTLVGGVPARFIRSNTLSA